MRLNHLNTISVSSRFVEIILVVISPWESFYTIGALCVSPHRYNTVSISNSVLIIPIWRGFFGIDAICVLTTAIQYRFHPDLLIYSSTWYQICYMRTVMCFNHIMPMPHSYFFSRQITFWCRFSHFDAICVLTTSLRDGITSIPYCLYLGIMLVFRNGCYLPL